MNRREALIASGVVMSGGLLNAKETATSVSLNRSYGTIHEIVPLPFDPKKVDGISEKVLLSHHRNNYAGAVKKLNLIQKQIASMPNSAHPIEYGALKKEELIAMNSKLLHELYFENLGGDGVITQQMQKVLVQAFGSLDAWKKDFVKTAKSLSGGSGWVILSYLKQQQTLMHQIASDHTDSLATGVPLLVLDMYEHSYHMDWGTKSSEYIKAFLNNTNWKIVSERLKMA